MLPAGRVPVASVFDSVLTGVYRPYHQMGCAGADLVIASGAPIGLGGSRRGDRPDFVVITVGACLDATLHRQRCSRRLPATSGPTPGHATSLELDTAALAAPEELRTAETLRCPSRASGRSPKSRNGSRDRSPGGGPAA